MSDTDSTTGASEADQDVAGATTSGAAADGGAGETRAAADSEAAFAAEKERMQATIRKLQSERDAAEARAKRIQEAAADIDSRPDTSQAQPAGLTMADLMRVREVDRLVPELKQKYPDADPALLDADPLRYESAEAYRLAVAQSHESRKALREQMEKEADEKVRARYAAAGYTPLADEAPPATATPPAGLPTATQLAAMSLKEQIAFEEANPGVIDKILASASGNALIGSKMGQP